MSEKKIMTREEIYDGLKTLALSQGFYGRLCQAIEEATEEQRECFFGHIIETEPTNMVDVVLYLEG